MSELYSPQSKHMDFVGHLEELRRRILICLAFFLVLSVVLFSKGNVLIAFLEKPAQGLIKEFIFLTPTEVFTTYLKVVCLAAFIVSFPVLLYELWAFLLPALAQGLKKIILGWLFLAFVCFIGGLVFSYELLLPAALSFLLSFGQGLARPEISVAKYISFATAVILLGGCVFQIPVIIGILTEASLLDAKKLRNGRRYAIVIIFIIAAIVTPTQDVVNLMLFAVPMVVLYEVGIVISAMIGKRKT